MSVNCEFGPEQLLAVAVHFLSFAYTAMYPFPLLSVAYYDMRLEAQLSQMKKHTVIHVTMDGRCVVN